jgi:methylmalonyl-CoA/ethylmalonyl-CoA epimerase
MIGRLNHVAIAVPDLKAATAVYRNTLGAEVSETVPQHQHGVSTVFVTLPNTKIELLEPLGDNSPILKFLEKNPDGGIHHICYEVDDIIAARNELKSKGARVVGDGEPKRIAETRVVQKIFDNRRGKIGAPGSVPGAVSPSC